MHAHESSSDHAERPRKPALIRPTESGAHAMPLTPDSLLRLQRTAGNGAVASALAVQRKKTMKFDDGQIEGVLVSLDDKTPNKRSSITVTDGWLNV